MKRLLTLVFLFSAFFIDAQTYNVLYNVKEISVWYSADSVHLTADNHVDTLYDKSGNEKHAVQNVALKQPESSICEEINKNKTIRFNGTGSQLNCLNNFKIGAMFVITRWNGNDDFFPAYNGFISTYTKSTYTYIFTGNANSTEIRTSSNNQVFWDDKEIYINNKKSTDFSPINQFKIVYGQKQEPGICDLLIGASYNNQLYWNGDIAEIIGFDSIPSDSVKDIVYNYLRCKYAPPIALSDSVVTYGFKPVLVDVSKPWFVSYDWNNGSHEPLAIAEPNYVYSVSVTDIFGYSSVGSFRVISPKPRHLPDTTICLGDTITWNPELSGPYTYKWSDGSAGKELRIATEGKYWVVITDTAGYEWHSDTITVNVDKLPNIHLFENKIVSVCKGEQIFPKINNSHYVYNWNTGSNEQYISIDNPGIYSLTLTDSIGCQANDSFQATISGISPMANFICDTVMSDSATTFINNSYVIDNSVITNYYWNFGDSHIDSVANPKHTYSDEGVYNVFLKVRTNTGCSNTSYSKAVVILNTAYNVTPIYPVDGIQLSSTQINFKWKQVKNCKIYRLQISTDSSFSHIIKDTEVHKNDTTLTIKENGNLFWRIKTYVGDYGIISKFNIFSISAINNLVFWYSADSVHLTVDNYVDTLYDKSGNGKHAVQNVALKQPELSICEEINKNKTIRFNGTGSQLNCLNNLKIGAMFVITRWNGDDDFFPAYNGFISTYTKSTYTYIFTGNANSTEIRTSSNNQVFWDDKEIYINNKKSTDFSPINQFKIVYGQKQEPGICDLLIGASYNNQLYWNGDIAEIIGFDAMPSDSVKDIVYNYLRCKYAPPVSLKDTAVSYGFKPVLVDVAKPWFVSYDWSNGSHGSAILAYPDTTYTVSVSDIFGFSSTDSLRVIFPKAKQPLDTTICLGDTITWNPDLSGPYYYLWSDGSADKTLKIHEEGQYWVVITDTTGYEWHSDTIFVKVDRFSQQMTLGADTINTCIGNNIYLQSGFDEATRYQWSDGTTADHLVVKSAGSYSVTASNLRGCIGHDTAHINTMGTAPTVGFDNSSLCATRQIAFTDKSSSNDSGKITSYHWDFGDGGISSAMNPAHIYDTSGNFQISYTISCENGCSNILKKNIYVNALPKADFSTSQACSNAPTRFTSTSTTANGYLTSWQWNINDSTYGIQNPQATFTQYGRHTIELIVTANNGCTDTLHRDIDILQGPEVDFTYSAPCFDSPIYLTNNSKTILGLSSSYTWKSDTAIFSTQKSPSITYKDTTTHQVTLTIKQIANGCISSLTKEIRVMPNPVPSILTGKICEGQDAILEGYNLEHASISKKWLWTIDSLQFTGEHRTSRTFGAKGKHKISLQITDSAGCVATFDTTVSVHETPTATFRPLSTRGPVPFQTEFTNTSANADSLLWIFGDGEESTDIDVCHTYHTDGIYNVQLIASNSFCSDTAQQVIEAIYPQIDIVLVSASAKTDNGQIAVSAVVANRSNYDIPNVSILWYDNVGHRISETIADTIKQGKIVQYEFVAKIGEARPDRIQYICVSAEPSTAYTDDTPSDNEYCIIFNKDEFSVCQPMPNPAKDKLAISYILPNDGNVRIELYNHNGGKIGNLYDSQASAGYNVHNFDVSTLNPGIYFYRITSGNESKTQMLIIER